jgi:hypothetical protein
MERIVSIISQHICYRLYGRTGAKISNLQSQDTINQYARQRDLSVLMTFQLAYGPHLGHRRNAQERILPISFRIAIIALCHQRTDCV